MYVPHLLYPFICWWTFRLFSCLSYHEQSVQRDLDTCGAIWIWKPRFLWHFIFIFYSCLTYTPISTTMFKANYCHGVFKSDTFKLLEKIFPAQISWVEECLTPITETWAYSMGEYAQSSPSNSLCDQTRSFSSVNMHRNHLGSSGNAGSDSAALSWGMCTCVYASVAQPCLFVTPWTVAHQAPPSMGFF